MNVRTGVRVIVSLPVLTGLVWACTTAASTAHTSVKSCHRYSSPGDVDARIFARVAETAAETLSTEHNGSYKRVSPASLRTVEPSIPISVRQARRIHESAYLLSASGTASSYFVTTRSLNGDRYSIIHEGSGNIKRHADVCGTWREW